MITFKEYIVLREEESSEKWFIDKGNKDDILTLAVWFESLEEDGHLEVLNQIKKLVQNIEKSQVENSYQLAQAIVNSDHKDYYLHNIQKIFQK